MSTRTGFGKVELFDDFLLSADHTGWNDNTENSGTAAQLANREDGWIELTTGTTSGNRSQITGERVWRSESGGPLVFEAGVTFVTDTTEKGVFIGFTDVTTIENPIEGSGTGDGITTNATDAVGFMYDEENTTTDRWFAVGVDSDTDAAGSGPLDATWPQTTPNTNDHCFRVEVDTSGNALFYIDGVSVYRANTSGWSSAVPPLLTGAVSPNVNLCPTVIVETREAGANTVYVDFIYCSKGRNP